MVNLVAVIGLPAALELLAEECTELAHAALKQARVLRGENPTPVQIPDAYNSTIEEIADVEVVLDALTAAWGNVPVRIEIDAVKQDKLQRLEQRLKDGRQKQ